MKQILFNNGGVIQSIDVFSKILIVKNDEFSPVYKKGDAIGIEKANDLPLGEVGAYIINDELFIKIRGLGVLRSINPDIPDISIDQTVRCIGRVIKKI